MSRHKHADKIIAKAENMDLVVIANHGDKSNPNWVVTSDKGSVNFPIWQKGCDYFLCLEKHKEACLHWLNGGEIEERGFYNDNGNFGEITIFGASNWGPNHVFMSDKSEFRIKPRKEKRWIAISNATGVPVNMAFKSALDAVDFINLTIPMCSASDFQFIEIEIEAIYEQLKFPPTRKA